MFACARDKCHRYCRSCRCHRYTHIHHLYTLAYMNIFARAHPPCPSSSLTWRCAGAWRARCAVSWDRPDPARCNAGQEGRQAKVSQGAALRPHVPPDSRCGATECNMRVCVCLRVLVCACVRHEMGGSGRRVEVEARGWIHWFSRSLQRTL